MGSRPEADRTILRHFRVAVSWLPKAIPKERSANILSNPDASLGKVPQDRKILSAFATACMPGTVPHTLRTNGKSRNIPSSTSARALRIFRRHLNGLFRSCSAPLRHLRNALGLTVAIAYSLDSKLNLGTRSQLEPSGASLPALVSPSLPQGSPKDSTSTPPSGLKGCPKDPPKMPKLLKPQRQPPPKNLLWQAFVQSEQRVAAPFRETRSERTT